MQLAQVRVEKLFSREQAIRKTSRARGGDLIFPFLD
jgi:hypothetical protein